MTELRRDHLLYLLQTIPKEGKEVTMVKWRGSRETKVAMTIYVPPEVKRGMKLAATLDGVTTSKLVEQLCSGYIENHPAVQKALREGG